MKSGFSVFAGVGERTREGNDFYGEMQESGVLDKVALVYGQMNEPPGNRLRVGLTGLTIAESFRDEGRDVLLFVDNIYRYTLAGTEVTSDNASVMMPPNPNRIAGPKWGSRKRPATNSRFPRI